MTAINTNLASIKARMRSSKSVSSFEQAALRLSTGLKVNNASDDAAGSSVANKLASQLAGIKMALRNTADGISLVQTALSGMSTTMTLTQRLREITVQASNGIYTHSDRINAQSEVAELLDEMKRVATNTSFNGVNLLDGSYNSSMRVGNAALETVAVTIDGMGVNKNIEGKSFAGGNAIQILSPEETATGGSAFDTPLQINATGGSTPTFLASSAANGSSVSQTRTKSEATGASSYTILQNASGSGTSTFDVMGSSSALGSDALDYLASANASGVSSFSTPNASSGGGTSALDILATNNASGSSSFNTALTSIGTGTSSLDFVVSSNGTGASQFNTPTSTNATGTSTLSVLAANSIATTVNSSDSPSSSTATGSSSRQILANTLASGSSAFNIENNSKGTGTSNPAGVAATADASIKTGGTSNLIAVEFDNYNFSEGVGSGSAGSLGAVYDIAGWEVHLKQIALGSEATSLSKTIGGFATPEDSIQPSASPGDETVITSWQGQPVQYQYEVANNTITIGTNDVATARYGQVHGPYIISKEALSLQRNDTVSFDWQAVGSGDAADVFAYLLNTDNGSTVELFNYTHPQSGPTPLYSASKTLETSGNYKFVFVSGSFDATGGTKVGSKLSISNIQIDQVNPSQSDTTIAEVTIVSEEANRITIARSLMGELDRIANADPGTGTFSIRQTGSDFNKFRVDANGNVTSTQTLLNQNQAAYSFEVRYVSSTGKTHTERVTLELLNSSRAISNITAQEGESVEIDRSALTLLNSFASADGLNGTFSIKQTGVDFQKFFINSAGNIFSIGALDFDDQRQFNFEVTYRSTDGRLFSNEITLNLTDTLSSSANLTAEESNRLTIGANILSSTATYAAKVPGGVYSLSGTDANKFTIDNSGNITSASSVLLANQENYNFYVNYIGSQGTHTESVSLRLTEALQSSSNLTTNESAQATITPQTLSKLHNFAGADNYRGTYRLESNTADPSDYTQFNIGNDGTITSNVAMVYATENRFDFDVVYRASTGIEYRESVVLNVINPSKKSSTIETEETQALTLTADKFINTAAFASIYTNTPTYTLSGTDAALFTIDASGVVTSNQSLALTSLGTYNYRKNYNFDVIYTSGTETQTENINLIVTEALQSNTSLTAAEASSINIEAAQLSNIKSFAARDRYRGLFAIATSSADFNKFSIDQTGNVTSNGALDFTAQPIYNFDVNYTASDGRIFTETVALSLTDTLTSSASISTEETQLLIINASTLASTNTYASRPLNLGGSYSIAGTDSSYFQVDGLGNVTSTQNLLRANKESYEFELIYNAGGAKIHTESVAVNLTEALQGTSNINADESGKVTIYIESLSNLSGFGSRDSSRGRYEIVQSGSDYNKFILNSNGNIESVGALDFTTQQQYQFDVAYHASDGRIFTDTVVLSLNDTLTSQASLNAVETSALTIPASQLASTYTYANRVGNTGGSYSLAGVDASKFSISNTGVVTSNGSTLVSTQDSFSFDVIYNAGVGKIHTETVSLYLSETLEATSTITAAESDLITIQKEQLQQINAFASRDAFSGSFRINQTGTDYNNFRVLNDGTIESTNPLDFSTQQTYQFEVSYTASNGRIFTETVNVNLTDTLISTSILNAEEALTINIPIATLASTETYSSRTGNTGGTFSLAGTDADLFQIDASGNVTSKGAALQSNKLNYAFTVVYDGGVGKIHRENVSLAITEALQSTATVSAQEANTVSISAAQLTKLDGFASRDSYAGYFYIEQSGADHNKFTIDPTTGALTSNQNLDFSNQENYQLNVKYRASDNRIFTSAVTLSLSDTLNSTAHIIAEETHNLTIPASEFTSTQTYANRTANVGGTYSLTGLDSDKFTVDGNGNVTSTQSILYDAQQTYQFNLVYSASAEKTHTEVVTLGLDRARQGASLLTAAESGQITITPETLSILNAVAVSDSFSGNFSILQTGSDYQNFYITGNGTVKSLGSLDYADQQSYTIEVEYQRSDGEKFTDTVTLNLTDTLTAEASLRGEESDLLTIGANELTSTQAFAALDSNRGTYSINPTIADGAKFTIDNIGNISTSEPLRRSNKPNYDFTVTYTASDGRIHNENVALTLDRFLQAASNLQSQESSKVIIDLSALNHLNDFVKSDNKGGRFSLGTRGSDYGLFSIDNNGQVTSISSIDFDTKNQFDFDIIYRSAAGKEFTNTVILNITDTLSASAALNVEESDQIKIDRSSLVSLNTYAAKDSGFGQISIDETGNHYSLFDVDVNGDLIAKKELRLEDHPTIQLDVRYNGVGIPDFIEHLDITLTPTTYDTTRSTLVSAEAREVIIIKNQNPYLRAYANADQNRGRFEITQSADVSNSDFMNFEIDQDGTVSSSVPIDFESGKTNYEFTILYHHSTNGNTFRDFVSLEIINDARDDNNLAIEDLNVLDETNSKSGTLILNQVVEKISRAQSKLGATQNRLKHNIDNLSMNSLVTEKARGRIVDADFARESANAAQGQIISNATTAMLAQANLSKLGVLMLIR
jgi:flagellin-like hook-associated protein FlgL